MRIASPLIIVISLRCIGVILNFFKLNLQKDVCICTYMLEHVFVTIFVTFVIKQLSPAHQFHECLAKLNHLCNKVLRT